MGTNFLIFHFLGESGDSKGCEKHGKEMPIFRLMILEAKCFVYSS